MGETSWFDGAGLGIFVHWDHASQQGLEVSWPMVGGVFALELGQSVSVEQYHSSAATFDPVHWDAAALAGLAKRAGARYAVLTSKHHSGYSMFDTALSEFSVVKASPYGRDIVAQFVEAMRNEGIRVGLYYSLSDWSHPDYPAFTEADKPYRFGMSPPYPGDERFESYRQFMLGQLRELLTNYGPIDLLWFDGQWERHIDQWRTEEIRQLIRDLQPDVIVNDRLTGAGDYETPEQFMPAKPPTGRWEVCMTMNESWGYNPADDRYKSPRQLVHTLCETTARGGNLLLNVSPKGDGSLPEEQVERLEAVGSWVERHGEAVFGVRPGLEPWQHYGPSTRRDRRIYLHLLARPYESVTVRGIPVKRLTRAVVLGTGQELRFRTRTALIDHFNPDPLGEATIWFPAEASDDIASVVALDLES
ncbi:MAG TPA: alpha-L-fucosidase [Acidimicrobiales bacterium]|nr:alpha-L-fucosidase [Acidimicrobiales bacterium]